MTSMDYLPSDIFSIISSHLQVHSLLVLYLTCKTIIKKLSSPGIVTSFHAFVTVKESSKSPLSRYPDPVFISLIIPKGSKLPFGLQYVPSYNSYHADYHSFQSLNVAHTKLLNNIRLFNSLTSVKLVRKSKNDLACFNPCIIDLLPSTLLDLEIDYKGAEFCLLQCTLGHQMGRDLEVISAGVYSLTCGHLNWTPPEKNSCVSLKDKFPILHSFVWPTLYAVAYPDIYHWQYFYTPFIQALPSSLTHLVLPFDTFNALSKSFQPTALPNLLSYRNGLSANTLETNFPTFGSQIVHLHLGQHKLDVAHIGYLPPSLKFLFAYSLNRNTRYAMIPNSALRTAFPPTITSICFQRIYESHIIDYRNVEWIPPTLTELSLLSNRTLQPQVESELRSHVSMLLSDSKISRFQLGIFPQEEYKMFLEPTRLKSSPLILSSFLTHIRIYCLYYRFEDDSIIFPQTLFEFTWPYSVMSSRMIQTLPASLTALSITYLPGNEVKSTTSNGPLILTNKMTKAHFRTILQRQFGKGRAFSFFKSSHVSPLLHSLDLRIIKLENVLSPIKLSKDHQLQCFNGPLPSDRNQIGAIEWPSSLTSLAIPRNLRRVYRKFYAELLHRLPIGVTKLSGIDIIVGPLPAGEDLHSISKRVNGMVQLKRPMGDILLEIFLPGRKVRFYEVSWETKDTTWITQLYEVQNNNE